MRGFTIGFGAIIVIGLIVLAVLRNPSTPQPRADATNAQLVAQGRVVYGQYCASCHGANLEGQPN
jgi:mono/diheme cytochrome c family protein